jgi:lysophospholipase L1-like esterase
VTFPQLSWICNDSGDGMHLNDKGAEAMASAVDPETLAL